MKTAAACPADAETPPRPLTERLRRGELFAAECASRDVFRHVTSLWGVLALIALRESGMLRFSELRRRADGVSEKMLAQTLKTLEADGFVSREALPVVPPHVEYRLTALGRQVSEHVAALADCVETSLPKVMRARQAPRGTSTTSARGAARRPAGSPRR